jgi:putative addiction module killer protein
VISPPTSTILRDRVAKARIDIRIRRLSLGNPGDVRPAGEGVSELRIHYGPSYRIYFTKQGEAVVILSLGDSNDKNDHNYLGPSHTPRDRR